MTPDRCCLKKKWVFKINRNGIFRARLVACGYSQISGVDYTAKYAPVVNDVTWPVLLLAILLQNYDRKLLYIEVAFLCGDLEEEIYMDCKRGQNCEVTTHNIWSISTSTSIQEETSEWFEEHGIQGWLH